VRHRFDLELWLKHMQVEFRQLELRLLLTSLGFAQAS
jgi:hypothetical protein